jgi:uroporphyrin-III C-methyltransferase/precorrin-2 dehydrogenase/sirohydrochlorin ferrochelatase
MRYFPLFVDLDGASVLVIGGGDKAVAKLRLLLKTDATLDVVAPDASDEIARFAAEGRVRWTRRAFAPEDAAGRRLIYVATEDSARDRAIAEMARAASPLVTVVDDREASSALTPAIVDRDPLVVAIGTEGAAPLLARRIKADIEAQLSPNLGALARLASRRRPMARWFGADRFKAALRRFFDGAGESALARDGERGAERLLDTLLASDEQPAAGHVALIGAGPGDPELLTLKARKRLDQADVVLYDRLVDPRVLELARREALLIEVGKQPEGSAWAQDDINALMIEHARAGAFVARLKSGDPLVFGRADEEIAALDAAGIAYEIVPGVTAAVAAAASARVSLTRRGRNQAISFLTARDAKGLAEHDWKSLARPGQAVAIYMGVGSARFVQGRLMLHGARADTPITIVENASRPDEKIVTGTLANLTELLARHAIAGPAIIFVGLARGARESDVVTPAQHREAASW